MVLGVGVVGLWGHEVYARRLAAHRATDLLGVAAWPGADLAMLARLDGFARDQRVPRFDSLDLLCQRGGLEAVLLMVPPKDNATLCVAALDEGLDVLCEKPIAGSPADLRALAAAVARARGVFTACYPLARYEPRIEALEGRVGRVRRASFTYLAADGPQYCATVPHYRDPELPADALAGGEAAMFSGYGVIALEHLVDSPIVAVQASLGCGWYAAYRERRQEDLARVELS
ncbi:MAG: Gfo/Idh/MocA family oxidoreductase, partial [Candidatus Methylomirabilis sp.]|nr:Gfo/Idh/MocA family oxidoreductase [Deltaproteobacteria bacterium]